MTLAPTGRAAGLELLDRSLAYTRGALATVRDADLARPTPCHRWSLAALLAHMDDALDAFLEGAAGVVTLSPVAGSPPAAARVESLQRKACALLGAWSTAVPDVVAVGGASVDVVVIAHGAALEIAVHGWDVGRATGRGRPLPEALAEELLAVARILVAPADRPGRFATTVAIRNPRSAAQQLLAFTGRDS